MKRVLYLTAAMLFSVGLYAQDPVNTNGSFEDAEVGQLEGNIEGWDFQGLGEQADFYIVEGDANVKDGTKGLMVVLNEIGDNAWNPQFVNTHIYAIDEQMYRFQIWAKADQEAWVSFTMNGGQDDGWDEIGRIDEEQEIFTSWTRYDYAFFAYTDGGGRGYVESSVHLGRPANADLLPVTYNFDELKIVKATTSYAETNGAGTVIYLGFHYALEGDASAANFSVTANGTDVEVSAVSVDNETSEIEITLASAIVGGAAITVAYDGAGGLEYGSYAPKNIPDLAIAAFEDPVDNKASGTSANFTNLDISVKLYPNPVVNRLNLEGINQIDRIDIVSITGQLVRSFNNSADIARLDVSDLNNGVYLVVLRSNNQAVKALRFVK